MDNIFQNCFSISFSVGSIAQTVEGRQDDEVSNTIPYLQDEKGKKKGVTDVHNRKYSTKPRGNYISLFGDSL